MKFLAVNILSIVLAAFAGILAWQQKEEWGWFLFAAILCQVSITTKEEEKK